MRGICGGGADGEVHVHGFYDDSGTADRVGYNGLFDLGDVFVRANGLVGGIVWDKLGYCDGGAFETPYYSCYGMVSTEY